MMSKDDQTGAVTVPTEVSQDETFYMTRRDYGLIVNGINRLGLHDIEQHQVRRCAGGNLQGHLAV
jgi:hypothetical protein